VSRRRLPIPDPAARLIAALHTAEAIADDGAPAEWAAWKAARAYRVDAVALAELWLNKAVACARARAAINAMRFAERQR
jgi:hypothetical protein